MSGLAANTLSGFRRAARATPRQPRADAHLSPSTYFASHYTFAAARLAGRASIAPLPALISPKERAIAGRHALEAARHFDASLASLSAYLRRRAAIVERRLLPCSPWLQR